MNCSFSPGYVWERKPKARVDNGYSDAFPVNLSVHQGSFLWPMLFINVLEAFSREFRTAEDLALISESLQAIKKNPVGIYMFKVNNRNTRIKCEIRSKLTIKTTERRQ